jgi:S1/P1 Nuclease
MKKFMFCILTLVLGQQVFAWGTLGHKTSAQIAWTLLDKGTKAKVQEILKNQSLPEVSTWADATRALPEWKFTVWYHFEKAPDNYTYLDNLKRQDEKYNKLGGVIEAIYVAEDMYKNANSTAEERENAIKFLVHFIGDIHQPLHTGRIEDNSGNKIPVKWLGMDVNLHQVWDSQMIYLGHKDFLANEVEADQVQKYTDYLLTKFKDFHVSPDLFLRYDDWMHESMVPRADAYSFKDESEQNYTNRFLDIVDLRIYLAGLRIASTLSRIVNQQQPPRPLDQLRDAIVKIVGNFSEFISLKPRPVPVTAPVAPTTP